MYRDVNWMRRNLALLSFDALRTIRSNLFHSEIDFRQRACDGLTARVSPLVADKVDEFPDHGFLRETNSARLSTRNHGESARRSETGQGSKVQDKNSAKRRFGRGSLRPGSPFLGVKSHSERGKIYSER